MKKKLKGVQFLLSIGISFWILFFPAYLHSYCLEEADFLSPNPIWENPDQEGFLAEFNKKGKTLGILPFSFVSLAGILLFESFHNFSFPRSSHDENPPVLRC